MYQPLADLLRPTSLDDICGQEHILGEGAVLRRLIDSGKIPNMIFYGPSGTGKTTVANIIAKQTNRTLYELNATTASTADIKQIVAQLDTFMAPNGVLLYLDEIQSFNKKQQQSLLEYIENGKITLIASTTENPYFYVFNAILSRSTVFEFKQITPDAALKAIKRAIAHLEKTNEVYEGVVDYLKNFSVSERDMTKYIIGTISNMDQPMTPVTKGDRSMNLYMNQVSEEMIRKERAEVLDATEEDIRALAEIVEAVLKKNYFCVIGNEEKLEEQNELFMELRSIF